MSYPEINHYTLRDGRRMGYCEYTGNKGKPVLYFHGFPGSHLDVKMFKADEIAESLGIRLVAVNRPGIGGSDLKKGRKLLDWPEDIVQLADALGMEKFSMLGYSGGGPYALACIKKVPDRIDKVVLVSSMAPFEAPESQEGAAMIIPKVPEFIQNIILKQMKKWLDEKPGKVMANMHKSLPPVDRGIIEDPGIREIFFDTLKENFDAGLKGAKSDAAVFRNDWGFSISEIEYPVHFWHGEEDKNVKPVTARSVANQLPGCNSRFLPGEGHLSLAVNHMQEILKLFLNP